MFDWKSILYGLGIALVIVLIALCTRGSSEVFIYNNF